MINQFQGVYRWLSNFWTAAFTYEGVQYSSVEHAYQAYKTSDTVQRMWVASSATAAIAKKRGNAVPLRSDWEQVKDDVMLALVRAKFTQNEALATKLVGTNGEELIEGNYWHDIYWGKCTCTRHRGQGKNKLGLILMQVRDELIMQGDS